MLRSLIPALCVGALAATPAAATTLARMDLGRLAQAAKVVVRAKCVGGESIWDGGEIWTLTRCDTIEVFKGHPPAEFTLRLIGGRVGAIESLVGGVPRFQPGEEVILFLDAAPAGGYSITAWSEGTFRVRRTVTGQSLVTQDTAAKVLYDPATHRFRSEGVRRMPLGAFRRMLRKLMRPPLPASASPAPAAAGTE